MTPKPYCDKSSPLTDASNGAISEVPAEVLPQTPSPESLSGATTPSPTPQEQVPVETFADNVNIYENNRMSDVGGVTPCYPTPGDIMPYDHSLPDFIRQITNQPNLANLQSLSLRVISTLISLHRMSAYLPNLRELDLEGSVLNSLRDIGCNLKNLRILKVGRCQLESLDGTFGLSSLRELYAQKNFINDVSPCSNLPHIRHIDVSGNRIRNISYAGFLSVCRKLKSIVFTGNPAAEVSGYRNHVRRILPQVKTLDGIPFTDAEEVAVPELLENYEEGSDSGSEVLDLSSVSPRFSASDEIKSDDVFLLDKKNKQEKNLANQDQSDAAEDEIQDPSARKGFVGQAKNIGNRSVNLKQKCTSIQKLDKDIENRSNKWILSLNSNLDEELVSSQGLSKCRLPEGGNAGSPSTSTSTTRSDTSATLPSSSLEEDTTKPPITASVSNSSIPGKGEEIGYGVMEKKSSSSLDKSRDEEQIMGENRETNKLTTGFPICGNLTAALRNRRKQNALAERQHFFQQSLRTTPDADGDSKLGTEHGSANEHDVIVEDILISSEKTRESFCRFWSDNT